ncbi:MAG: dTDP-glucose 4,6-dehydratase [Planctomycetota bacterium]
MKAFVTGGAGFIGSNFVRLFLMERPKDSLVNFDALTYAGNLGNLEGLENESRHHFVKGDIRDLNAVRSAMKGCDVVVNFAAESHVDRSIENPGVFVDTNVLGTQMLLSVARELKVARFLQVSTDEVYGSLGPTGLFTEETPLQPNSPYSASKAGADCLVRAAYHTHGMATLITRCSNNYGPYQFPEKLIPLFISNALEGKPLPLYGDGGNVRDWLFVEDHNKAILKVLEGGRSGEVYNIGGNNEMTNRIITLEILRQLGKPESLIKMVADRPGHDRRYAIDAGKIRRELGWEPRTAFKDGLAATIQWYRDHGDWWSGIKSGAYMAYYERMYGKRLGV